MSLLENWQKIAYNQNQSQADLQRFWQNYFLLEKGIYEQLLDNPDEEVKGTVKELAEKYNIELMPMVGFLDGINESLVKANPIETMEEGPAHQLHVVLLEVVVEVVAGELQEQRGIGLRVGHENDGFEPRFELLLGNILPNELKAVAPKRLMSFTDHWRLFLF